MTFVIGAGAHFVMLGFKTDRVINLSSKLEDIGINWDVEVKNNTPVIILSDPIKVVSPKHGEMEVIQVCSDDKTFWARTDCIINIDPRMGWN